MSSDNKSCDDINECTLNNGGCSDYCNNLNGTFACSCPIGTILGSDLLTCQRKHFNFNY